MSERLEKEKDYFVKNMIEWSKTHLYKFALIKEESLVGVYNTIQDAFNAGLSKYGLDDFFINSARNNKCFFFRTKLCYFKTLEYYGKS
jgi:hypothetical protein